MRAAVLSLLVLSLTSCDKKAPAPSQAASAAPSASAEPPFTLNTKVIPELEKPVDPAAIPGEATEAKLNGRPFEIAMVRIEPNACDESFEVNLLAADPKKPAESLIVDSDQRIRIARLPKLGAGVTVQWAAGDAIWNPLKDGAPSIMSTSPAEKSALVGAPPGKADLVLRVIDWKPLKKPDSKGLYGTAKLALSVRVGADGKSGLRVAGTYDGVILGKGTCGR